MPPALVYANLTASSHIYQWCKSTIKTTSSVHKLIYIVDFYINIFHISPPPSFEINIDRYTLSNVLKCLITNGTINTCRLIMLQTLVLVISNVRVQAIRWKAGSQRDHKYFCWCNFLIQIALCPCRTSEISEYSCRICERDKRHRKECRPVDCVLLLHFTFRRNWQEFISRLLDISLGKVEPFPYWHSKVYLKIDIALYNNEAGNRTEVLLLQSWMRMNCWLCTIITCSCIVLTLFYKY